MPNIVFKFWGDEGDTVWSPQVSRMEGALWKEGHLPSVLSSQ